MKLIQNPKKYPLISALHSFPRKETGHSHTLSPFKNTFLLLFCLLFSFSLVLTGCGRARNTVTGNSSDTPSATLKSDTDDQNTDSQNTALPHSTGQNSISESSITPAMWKVTDREGHVIYMMGSIHMADIDATVFPSYFETAYAECDSLAVEYDITNANGIFSMYRKMVYTDGTSIVDHVPPESYEKAVKLFQKEGQYTRSYELMKPIVWVELAETIAAANSGLSAEYGIDTQLIQRAKEDQKEILEVESLKFQSNLLFNMPEDIQLMLFENLTEDDVIEKSTKQLTELYENWKTGRLSEEDTADETSDPDLTEEEAALLDKYNNKLLYERNTGMKNAALRYMKDGKKVLFIVGSAHFYGEKGILALMETEGCQIEQLSPTANEEFK